MGPGAMAEAGRGRRKGRLGEQRAGARPRPGQPGGGTWSDVRHGPAVLQEDTPVEGWHSEPGRVSFLLSLQTSQARASACRWGAQHLPGLPCHVSGPLTPALRDGAV